MHVFASAYQRELYALIEFLNECGTLGNVMKSIHQGRIDALEYCFARARKSKETSSSQRKADTYNAKRRVLFMQPFVTRMGNKSERCLRLTVYGLRPLELINIMVSPLPCKRIMDSFRIGAHGCIYNCNGFGSLFTVRCLRLIV